MQCVLEAVESVGEKLEITFENTHLQEREKLGALGCKSGIVFDAQSLSLGAGNGFLQAAIVFLRNLIRFLHLG